MLSVIVTMVACSNKALVKARVYERKEAAENILKIKYSYAANGKLYTDSATVTNKVMEGDSINISINLRKPGKSRTAFNK
ncbi:MAG: hypothetical protein JWQ96_3128 [Segetibacter sp.]|nr:hypothetical protein [Segetibacter sp.]